MKDNYFLFKDIDSEKKLDDGFFSKWYNKTAGVELTLQRANELESSQQLRLVSIMFFAIVRLWDILFLGFDFEKIPQTQKFALSEWAKGETSHFKMEKVNWGGLIYSENSMSISKYSLYRATYTVTALKTSVWYDNATYLNKKTRLVLKFDTFKIISLQKKLRQGHKLLLPGLNEFDFSVLKEILDGAET